MKALTVKQPCASLIVERIKPIENRTWATKYRGRVLIHAGQDFSLFKNMWKLFSSEQSDVICKDEKLAMQFTSAFWELSSWRQQSKFFPTSQIIGSVEIVDCVINHPSIWAEKTSWKNPGHLNIKNNKPIYNWVLANPIKFDKQIPCKGKLSFLESGYDEIVCPNCGKIRLAQIKSDEKAFP